MYIHSTNSCVLGCSHENYIYSFTNLSTMTTVYSTKVGKNARYNLKIVNFNGLDLCIWGELSHSRSRYQFCFQIITNVNNHLY